MINNERTGITMRLKTILVDDELWSMKQFELECKNKNIEIKGEFDNALDALSFVENNRIDLALLDVKMPDMDGINLGRRLKEINPDMIVIFISGYEEYLKEAMLDLKADYYLLKPYNGADVEDVLERAEYLSARLRKRVMVKTFGDFDIFVDGMLIEFKNQKAKELFAICIDNGGGEVTMKKVIEKLWEGRNYDDKVKRLYRKAIIYLNSIFKRYGVEYIFTSNRGNCHVNRKELICDYYDVLDGKNINETLFDGRYMTNYSWSEETCGKLCSLASIHLYE